MGSGDSQAVFLWCFAQAEFDELRRELRVCGEPVPVEPRPLDVLSHLLRHAGEAVSREELQEAVYGHQHIGEGALSNAIGKLRRVLGDDEQAVIATVHRVGYRIVVPVKRTLLRGPSQREPSLRAGDPVPRREHWRLQCLLGSGGDVEVWLAEHDKTRERRVFKFSVDGLRLSALKREATLFRVVREVLGEREDFARVLDWNFEEAPYFLECEYGGANLIEWVEQAGGLGAVPLAQRLELIADTAAAVGAAHSAGVLHKDLKPANILVYRDSAGVWRPRLTDFGSGRLIEPEQLAALGITRLGFTQTQAISGDSRTGTLLYLAPEVLNGQAPTALSDIYALGILLYQMAVGDFRRTMAAGWEADIADEVLRGDIAAAAAGNPAARLGSAQELALRLRQLEVRHAALLQQRAAVRHAEALQRKFDRARARRPWLIGVVATLLLGLGLCGWFYRDAARARDDARQQAAVAQGYGQFLTEDVLGATSRYNPTMKLDFTVRQALDRAVAELDRGPPRPPLIEATIRDAVSYTYMQMSDYAAAETQARKAAELYRDSLGPDDSRTLHADYGPAEILLFDSRFDQAGARLAQMRSAIALHPEVDPDLVLASDALSGYYYYCTERYEEAATYYEKALAEHRRVHPQEAAGLVTRQMMLALSYAQLGRFAEANPLFQQALETAGHAAAPDQATPALGQAARGIGLYLQGHMAEAEQALSSAHEQLQQHLGADARDTAQALDYLGLVYLSGGRGAAALSAERSAYAAYLQRFGPNGVFTLTALGHMGMAEFAAGQHPAALHDLRQAADGLEKVLGWTAPRVQYFRYWLVVDSLRDGKPVLDAAGLLQQIDAGALRREAPQEDWVALLRAAQSELSKNLARG